MTPAPPSATPTPDPAAAGRLSARPQAPASPAGMTPGATSLGLGAERDGQIVVPAGYDPAQPAPLVVLLHGAGGRARDIIGLLQSHADAEGMLLLAIDSRAQTWDVIVDRYGPDVRFLDQALSLVFQRYAVDPGRIAIAGFSDGASYALSLGISNGDLFTHVLAFSPGFLAPKASQGRPALYISHGTRDEVLPIDVCSRRIVPELEQAGYAVTYHEFDGPHTVPQEIAGEAVAWFLGGR
jgi:phospholipase/carboxylesterase